MKKKIISMFLAVSLLMPAVTLAAPEEPPGGFGGGPGGAPGGVPSNNANISYTGVETLTSGTYDGKQYESSIGGQNAILASSGEIILNNPYVNKTGDSSGDEADFYGTNAAILAYDNANLTINGGIINTNGSHANALFAYGTGNINVQNTRIETSSNNSGGIMVTGGGTLTATNLTVTTMGDSSASIRSDRGGGTMKVTGGIFTTNGNGSPAIYSTADITVEEAILNSNTSEGIVIEGANSVTLNKTRVIDNNIKLNGNSETYKNIFIYQSMSGDASEGTGTFTATDSELITNNGDTFFITNTNAIINLTNNVINNNSGDFLRVQAGKWGNTGSNGGNVTLNLNNQRILGNIIVDNVSTINMNIANGSYYSGIINGENTAKEINITLSSDSVLILTGNTYISSLKNEVEDNSNIYSNGYNLYIGEENTEINEDLYVEQTTEETNIENKKSNLIFYIIGGGVAIIVILGLIKIFKKKN